MTARELIALYSRDEASKHFAEYMIYKPDRMPDFEYKRYHMGRINAEYLDGCTEDEELLDREVLDWEFMNEAGYNAANFDFEKVSFEELYGDAAAKVLVIVVSNKSGEDEENA